MSKAYWPDWERLLLAHDDSDYDFDQNRSLAESGGVGRGNRELPFSLLSVRWGAFIVSEVISKASR